MNKRGRTGKFLAAMLLAIGIGGSEASAQSQFQVDEPIRLVFAGDTMMDGSVKAAIRLRGVDDPFRQVKAEIAKADWAVANLETAVTTAAGKDPDQLFHFKSDPASLIGLRNAGFDMVSLANNHVLDYAERGLRDTLRYLKAAHLAYAGAGLNDEQAFAAKRVILKGKTVKIAAFSRFMPTLEWNAGKDKPGVAGVYEKRKALSAIRAERGGADYLIVFIHWGIEKHSVPDRWQRDFAKEMIDAGADAVVGSHPHVLQGFEFYEGKPIAYSIGNFLFPDYVKGKKADTGLLKLTLHDGKVDMAFDPYYIRDNRILKRDRAYERRQLDYLAKLSFGVRVKGHRMIAKGV